MQIDSSAEPEVIAAYKRLALKYHPDTNKSADTTVRMQDRNEAYTRLCDPAKRAQYDKTRSLPGSDQRQANSAALSYTSAQPKSPYSEDYDDALDHLQGSNVDDKARREAASLLYPVVTQAENEFPLARAILALVMMNLGDVKTAELHANIALKRNANDFRA